jgi:hypothetical protein
MTEDRFDEDRLRSALHAGAGEVDPDEVTSLSTIRQRGRAAIRRRRAIAGGVGALVLVAAAAVIIPQLGADEQSVIIEPGPQTTTTIGPIPTTTSTVPTTTPPLDMTPYLWPPPGHDQYTDPTEAARSFATEYVDLPDPMLGAPRAAEPRLVEIDVLAQDENGRPFDGRIWSTLQVAQTADGTWRVRSAASEEVVIESFTASATSVTMAGRGNGFEGTMNASALDADGNRLGESVVTVLCCEGPQPFETTFAVSGLPSSLLLVSSTGLESGSAFSALPNAPAVVGTAVQVYFVGSDGTVQPQIRHVEPPAVLNGALAALFAGPSADEHMTTALPEAAATMTPAATIAGGEATVDIPIALAQPDPSQPGAVLPVDQADLVIEQLTRTVFQFDNLTAVTFELGGSCEDFGRWTGHRGECRFERS